MEKTANEVTAPMPDDEKFCIVQFAYTGTTEEELTALKGDELLILEDDDPDWLLCRKLLPDGNDSDEQGYIPRSFVKMEFEDGKPAVTETKAPAPSTTKAGDKFRLIVGEAAGKLATQQNQTITSQEQLNASMGKATQLARILGQQLPSGFRNATLEKLRVDGYKKLSTLLIPKMTEDQYAFHKFQADRKTGMIKAEPVKCSMAISVVQCVHMPYLSHSFVIQDRFVNMTIFDRKKVLSNIQKIPARLNQDGEESAWRFSVKNRFMFPRDDENAHVVRIDETGPDLCVLFELTVVLKKRDSNELSTMSAGWCTLPLYEVDGTRTEPKNHELKLHGGTPADRDVPVSINGQTKPLSTWERLRNSLRHPRLIVKVWKLSSGIMQEVDKLPPLILVPLQSVPVISTFRNLLCDALIANSTVPNIVPHFLPSCEQFLKLVDHPLLLRTISYSWEQTWKDMKSAEKKSTRILGVRFLTCVAAIWAATAHVNFHSLNQEDQTKLLAQCQIDGPLRAFSNPPTRSAFKPFNTAEVIYSHLEHYPSISQVDATL